MLNKDAFKPLTKDEIAEKEQKHNEALHRIQEVREAAKNCLRTDLFDKYFQSYIKAYDSLFELFLSIHDDDPWKRLSKFDILQAEANSLRSLLKGIVKDAQESPKKEN